MLMMTIEPPNIDINLDLTEDHHEDEVDDESADEPFYDSEDKEDDGEGDDEDEMTLIGEAYVPPSYMASTDLAYVDQVDGTWLYEKICACHVAWWNVCFSYESHFIFIIALTVVCFVFAIIKWFIFTLIIDFILVMLLC
ncbi:hypothetical protein P8452_62427 [Trifolium repens]|nr:hypothetical protein P8452_62427 [Trifolium repens]